MESSEEPEAMPPSIQLSSAFLYGLGMGPGWSRQQGWTNSPRGVISDRSSLSPGVRDCGLKDEQGGQVEMVPEKEGQPVGSAVAMLRPSFPISITGRSRGQNGSCGQSCVVREAVE